MGRKEILLKQYEVCQQDKNSLSTIHWTVASIFLGLNTGLLVWIFQSAITGSIDLEKHKWLYLALSSEMILILISLILWLNRVNHLIQVNNKVMKKIEYRSNLIKKDLSTPCPFEHWWEYLLFFVSFLWWIPSEGRYIVKFIYLTLILLWTLLITLAFCQSARELFLN